MAFPSKLPPSPVTLHLPSGETVEASPAMAGRAIGLPELEDLISGLLGSAAPGGDKCPFCGWLDEEYQAGGYVGCPLCYSSLASLRGQQPG